MKTIRDILAAATLATVILCAPATTRADSFEIEPNDTCETAQTVGYLGSLPHAVRGSLDPVFDVDFFVLEAEPGAELQARLLGAFSGEGSLEDPFLGAFHSHCEFIAADDDGGGGLESRLRFTVPANGRIVLAATACCDTEFTGNHGQEGSYALVIEEAPPAIGSISGRLTDSKTGQGLSGMAPTFAWLSLNRCADVFCWDFVTSVAVEVDGRFQLSTDYLQRPIETGSFVIEASAMAYDPAVVGPFEVGPNEHLDLGDIPLAPPPMAFGAVTPCDDLPSAGGTCRYSVEVRNNTADSIGGLAWSNVVAHGTGSRYDFSQFTAARHQVSNIRGMSGATLRFSFDVPAGVADGAFICVDAWFSNRDNAFLGTILQAHLFCVVKSGGSFQAADASSLPAFQADRIKTVKRWRNAK